LQRAGGRTSYRGLVQVQEGATRSDTYPYVDVREDDVEMGHEASVSKISEDQLFYLMSRGMTKDGPRPRSFAASSSPSRANCRWNTRWTSTG
jgi:Fe-S cluster assembly scaffold protein SufB